MIFVIDDDEIMAECIARACGNGVKTRIFSNVIAAMNTIAVGKIPKLIFLDVMLTGPDGFTFLNEMISYPDTAKIPIVIVTSLRLAQKDFSTYGVVGVLEKDTMLPQEIKAYVEQYAE